MKISVLVFFFNEAANLPLLRSRIADVFSEFATNKEVVLVNDCSTDESADIASNWVAECDHVTSIRFSRNFGSHAAVAAGLQHCTGDCAVIMAADLQDPPELIPELVKKFEEGFDVVWACRSERLGESWFTTTAAECYYRLMRWLGLPNMPPKGADFLLVSRKVIDAVNRYPEKHTSVLAMILWMGFKQSFIEYVKQPRHAGKSKWTFWKKIKLLIDSVVSFSYVPIRLIISMGFLMAITGIVYAMIIIIGRVFGWVNAGTGFAALMSVVLVGQGATMVMLGILGEYLWRTFDESRGRPRFIVDEIERSKSSGQM